MTKAENSRVAQSDEPSADRIAADLVLTSWDHAETSDSVAPGVGVTTDPNFSATVVIDTASDAGSYADHIRDTAAMRGAL